MTSLKLLGMAKLERACIGIIEIPIQELYKKLYFKITKEKIRVNCGQLKFLEITFFPFF